MRASDSRSKQSRFAASNSYQSGPRSESDDSSEPGVLGSISISVALRAIDGCAADT